MAPIKAGSHEFSPDSLVKIREQLKLTQAKMASLLTIPPNTLSRWETGATTPDAGSLAAIYSLALEQGVTPSFFRRRRPHQKQPKQRSRLLVMLDFQNLGVSAYQVPGLSTWLKEELEKKFPATSYSRYKVFASPHQSEATEQLEGMGWRAWEDSGDMDEEIVNQCKSDCGQEPKDTVLVLITRDGDFAALAEYLKALGVAVYVVSTPFGFSQKLHQAVGPEHWIQLPLLYPHLG